MSHIELVRPTWKTFSQEYGVNDLLSGKGFDLLPSHQGFTAYMLHQQHQKTQPYNHQQTHNAAQTFCRSNWHSVPSLYNYSFSHSCAQPGPAFLLAPLCGGTVLSPCFAHLLQGQTWCCSDLSRGHHRSKLTHVQPLEHHLAHRAAGSQLLHFSGSLPCQRLPWLQQGKADTFLKGINVSAPTWPNKQKPNDTRALPHTLLSYPAPHKGCGSTQCCRPALYTSHMLWKAPLSSSVSPQRKCSSSSTLTLLPQHKSIPPEHFCEQVHGSLYLLSQISLLLILIVTVFRKQLRMGLHCTRYCTNTQQDYLYRYIGVVQYQCFCENEQ